MSTHYQYIVFGEVLWDHFPTYSTVGGAPLNVALRLKSLGAEVNLISAIGVDDYGEKIVQLLEKSGIDTSTLTKSNYKTGAVNVVLNDKGNASYDIVYPSAWDKIEFSEEVAEKVVDSDLFVFGSLATRDEDSKMSLKFYLNRANYNVFDVNLRAPHYTYDGIKELMEVADMIKLNDEELYEIAWALGSKYNSFRQNIEFLSQLTNTNTICVTKGAFGAVLYQNGNFYNNNGYKVKVVDTVGSGDSFLATMLYTLFTSNDPQNAIDKGCAVGAIVANSEGANPEISSDKIKEFMML